MAIKDIDSKRYKAYEAEYYKQEVTIKKREEEKEEREFERQQKSFTNRSTANMSQRREKYGSNGLSEDGENKLHNRQAKQPRTAGANP